MKKLLTLSAIALCGSAPAAVVASFDFNNSLDGFGSLNVAGFAATTTGVTGTASTGDPQLIRGAAEPVISATAGATFSTIEFRVSELNGGDPITSFDSTGLVTVINGTAINGNTMAALFSAVDSGDDFFTVTIDISGITDTEITTFRLDPIGGPDANGNSFEVDFIRITDTAVVPEPSTSLLGLLAGAMLLRRRRS